MKNIDFSTLSPTQQDSLSVVSNSANIASYETAKATIKVYESHVKTLKAAAKQFTDQGEDVVFSNGTQTLATLKTSKASTAKNFQINIKALYTIWKDKTARQVLSDFFKLTFQPLKGFSEKAIAEAENAAQIAQLQGAGGQARGENPEIIFNRVSESYRVSLKV